MSDYEMKCKGHQIEVYGNKGMSNKQFRKSFPTYEHAEKWADKNDATIVGRRDLKEHQQPHWKQD